MKGIIMAIDRRVSRWSLDLACLLLVVVSLLGIWQVITRFVLSQPSTWTEEALRRLLIWMVMLGIVAAFRRGALVSVDLMLRLTRGRLHAAVHTLVTVVSLAFLLVLAFWGFDLVWRVRFQSFASMEMSMGWGYLALPVGAVLSMIAVLAHHFDPLNTELEMAQ